jgi:hypothetical protein
MARLRTTPSGEEAARFTKELRRETLRPELLALTAALAKPRPTETNSSSKDRADERNATYETQLAPQAIWAWRIMPCPGGRSSPSSVLAEAPEKGRERSVQIEGAELTESGQRARSNRNVRLRVELTGSPSRRRMPGICSHRPAGVEADRPIIASPMSALAVTAFFILDHLRPFPLAPFPLRLSRTRLRRQV